MPVVTLDYEDLERLVGGDRDEIIRRIPMIGADIERVEEDHIDIEFFPDRPDLFSTEGVARAMRGFLGIEKGLPQYDVADPSITITLDEEIKRIRPYIGCAVVKGLYFDDPSIQSLMDLQEDLHWGLGRNRKKVSIGVHDISRVRPPFRYVAMDPEFEFVPLDFDVPMSMRDILTKHPKGVDYAYIVEPFDKYPLILDADDNVLSFPPIINGELTRVKDDTHDLFIDVTGTDEAVYKALNIVVTALAERGGTIEAVKVEGSYIPVTPDLNPTRRRVTAQEASDLIGVELSPDDVAEYLRRMRYGASVVDGVVEVDVPAYRSDVIHTWDLIEDVAIGYGFENIPAIFPGAVTVGEQHHIEMHRNKVRQIMVGLGYLEVMPFTLTNERVHYEWMRREPEDGVTYVMHPISLDHTMVRTTIIPNILEILSMNQHRELPQRVFAVGDVVRFGENRQHLAAATTHAAAGFAEAKALADALMRELGVGYEAWESKDPAFLDGRRADIVVDGEKIGVFGEIHPEAIAAFGMDHPIAAIEIRLDRDA